MRSRLWSLLLAALVVAPATRAADVEELFGDSLFAGRIDIDLLGPGQLDDSRCWGHDDKTGELVCVLFERKGEAATWTVVVFEPQAPRAERFVIATRAELMGDAVAGPGRGGANAAMKKRRWRPLDPVMQVAEKTDKALTAALSGGRTLNAEGRSVTLRDGGSVVAELVLGRPGGPTHVSLYAARGGVVSLEVTVGKESEAAALRGFGNNGGSGGGKGGGVGPGTAPGSPGRPAGACKSCPSAWAELSALMGVLCAGSFGEAELSTLKGHVAAGRLDKDEVARLWNTVGAMTGYVFKKYPQWNALFYGEDKAYLPAACKPWLDKAHKEGALPAGIRAGRDRIRNYWKTL